ncbi:MAG: hypothetical protein ABL958_13150 [Bdellovibrionia bacterium]
MMAVPVTSSPHSPTLPVFLDMSYFSYPHLEGGGLVGLGITAKLTRRFAPEAAVLLPVSAEYRYGSLFGARYAIYSLSNSILFVETTFTLLNRTSQDLRSLGLHIGWSGEMAERRVGFALGVEGIDRISPLTNGSRLSSLHSIRTSFFFVF